MYYFHYTFIIIHTYYTPHSASNYNLWLHDKFPLSFLRLLIAGQLPSVSCVRYTTFQPIMKSSQPCGLYIAMRWYSWDKKPWQQIRKFRAKNLWINKSVGSTEVYTPGVSFIVRQFSTDRDGVMLNQQRDVVIVFLGLLLPAYLGLDSQNLSNNPSPRQL